MLDEALRERKRRLKQIRTDLKLTQEQLLPVLNAAAARLGLRTYTQSTLSKIEGGSQDISFDAVATYAAIDPEGRGRLWLAWGDTPGADGRKLKIQKATPESSLAIQSQKPLKRATRDEPARRPAARKAQ